MIKQTSSANANQTRDSWSFALAADEQLRSEFPDRDPTTNTLLLLLNRASADVISILESDVHKPLGLSWSGYKILFVLWIAGDLEPARVADLTHTSRALVSNLSGQMIKDGILDRQPSPTDGRSVRLSLTDAGIELVNRAYLAHDQRQSQILSGLTDTERDILLTLLAKVTRTVNTANTMDQ